MTDLYDSEGDYFDRTTEWFYNIDKDVCDQLNECKPWFYRLFGWLQERI